MSNEIEPLGMLLGNAALPHHSLPLHSLSAIFWWREILHCNVGSRINFSLILNAWRVLFWKFCLMQAGEVFSLCSLFFLVDFCFAFHIYIYNSPGVDLWVWCEIEVKNIFRIQIFIIPAPSTGKKKKVPLPLTSQGHIYLKANILYVLAPFHILFCWPVRPFGTDMGLS